MNIWERQPSETPKAFAAFGLYLNIPPLGRSVRAAVELFRKQGGKTSERNWETWASRYNWRNRAAEHDSGSGPRRLILFITIATGSSNENAARGLMSTSPTSDVSPEQAIQDLAMDEALERPKDLFSEFNPFDVLNLCTAARWAK